MTGVVWKPRRLVVFVGDRKLEDSHARDATRTSLKGVGKARHRCEYSPSRGTRKGEGQGRAAKTMDIQSLTQFFEPNDEHTIANVRRSSTGMVARAKDGHEEIKHPWPPLAPHAPSNIGTKSSSILFAERLRYEDGREGRGVTRDRRATATIPGRAR